MRTNRLIFGVVFWLFAAFLFAADADLRTWSSSGGGHSLKAEYLGKKGKDKAYLLKEDGRLKSGSTKSRRGKTTRISGTSVSTRPAPFSAGSFR